LVESLIGYLNKMENEPGALRKLGGFLGINKFGQGLATAGRVLSGETGKDIALQQANTVQIDRLVYAAKQEKDPEKRKKLLSIAQGFASGNTSASDIDPGLNLTKKEVLGSAANIGLNILTPAAFRGSKAAILGKNAALGAGFGTATGMADNKGVGGIVGNAIGGAAIGTAIGGAGIGLRALKDFTSKTSPKWLMDKAIRPSLDEARKNVKFGQKTLGEELLNEGVKGGPQKLLDIADQKLTSLEDELQSILSSSSLAESRITRSKLTPYFKDLIETKSGIPGLDGDVKAINKIINAIPEEMTLQEANVMKRRIYGELRDVAYKLDSKLGNKAKALKVIAAGLKREIENEVGGTVVKDINQKLSIYGRLENRITDELARSMRQRGISWSDALIATGGIANLTPAGLLSALGAIGVKHAVGSAAFKTNTANLLTKTANVGTGRAANILKGTAKRAALNLPGQNNP
jgi:hypothetical protein